MSKSGSGLFIGTAGDISSRNYYPIDAKHGIMYNSLDLRPHPTKYKQFNSKKLKEFNRKEASRTLTKAEYKRREWQKRLNIRRKAGIDAFWEAEKERVLNGLPTTRNWSAAQRADILRERRPKFRGVTMQSHHTYSVAQYPHLANIGHLIFPATKNEHFYGWHGGSTRKSLPGKPIKVIKEF